MIDWSHQVYVVLRRDSSEELLHGTNPTPLTELLFWDNRSEITNVRTHSPGVYLEEFDHDFWWVLQKEVYISSKKISITVLVIAFTV